MIDQAKSYLTEQPWELYVTLPADNMELAEWAFKKWRRYLFEVTKLEVACKGIFLAKPIPHYHLLMFGKKARRKNTTLASLPQDTLQALLECWRNLAHRPADIQQVWHAEGLADYLTGCKNIARPTQQWCFVEFNPNLLKRTIKDRRKAA